MTKQMKGLIVALALTMGLSVTASANFSDVQESDWYYDNVQMMVDSGIVSGYEDGTFRPTSTVTMGEMSKMLYLFWGYDTLPNGTDHWAEYYAADVMDLDWLSSMPDDLNQAATRIEVAEAILNSISALPDPWVEDPFSDVDSYIANTLYDMGIMNGTVDTTTGERTLSPDAAISRAEFCALLSRTSTYMNEEYGITDFRFLQPHVKSPDSVSLTEEFFEELFLYMLVNNHYEYSFTISGTTATSLESSGVLSLAESTFWKVQEEHHEIGAFFDCISSSMSSSGNTTTWTITLGNSSFDLQTCVNYRYSFLLDIGYWAQNIYDEGLLDPNDSDYEKAKYLYYFCANNFAYDTSFNPMNYNGYGMLQNKVGVCQAYVSVYNALCKMWGVDIIGVAGQTNGVNHIWSYADLDGTWYYIDPTYGDPVPDRAGYCDYTYFAMTREEISQTHVFND